MELHRSKIELMRGYRVRTVIDIPADEHGERDPYNEKCQYFYYTTLEKALAKAKELAPKDFWGSCQVDEFEWRAPYKKFPNVMEMELIGDTIFVEKD